MESESKKRESDVDHPLNDQQLSVQYFATKFDIPETEVQEAITHIGNSSEMLEQYFLEQQRKAHS